MLIERIRQTKATANCLSDLPRLQDGLSELLQRHGVADPDRRRHLIAVEEVVVNALQHAGANVSAHAKIDEMGATTTLRYGGPPYDVETAVGRIAPSFREGPGGRGLVLVQHSVDSVDYSYINGVNTVVLRQSWREPQSAE